MTTFFRAALMGLSLLLCSLLLTSQAFAQLIIVSPLRNQNTCTSVNVVATSKYPGTSNIQVWEGSHKWGVENGTSINQTYTFTPGSHTIVIEAVNSSDQPLGVTATWTFNVVNSGGLVVAAPGNNVNADNPVQVVACSEYPGTVNIQVWEGSTKYGVSSKSNPTNPDQLNANYSMTTGLHNIVIEAVNSSDEVIGQKTVVPFNVSGGGGYTMPTPPPTAIYIHNVQDVPVSEWKAPCSGPCSGCPPTNQNCGAPYANYTWGPVSTPSLSGTAMSFNLATGPIIETGQGWPSVLFADSFGAQDSVSNFLEDFYFYLTDTNSEALEWDFWQVTGGQKYMAGTQCIYGTGEYDGWNEVLGEWQNSGATCPAQLAPNTWHHLRRSWARVGSTVVYQYVQFDDGPVQAMNLTEPAAASNWGDSAGLQFQLDYDYELGNPAPGYSEYIDNVNAWMW